MILLKVMIELSVSLGMKSSSGGCLGDFVFVHLPGGATTTRGSFDGSGHA